tara:strand:- start:4415 stop:4993 length:579 start_codon:yes stop_codon:yes gene_type:complete
MRMTQNRISAIMTGLGNEVFGHMTPIIQQLMDQALENGTIFQDAYGERHFTSAGSKWRPEFNAYWSAVVELVRHTHEPLLSKGSIPKQVKANIHHIKNAVFKMETSNLWEMKKHFGFVPYKPHGREHCYDQGDEGMNENAVGQTIAQQRANAVENRLLKCYRDGTWDGTHNNLQQAFNFPVWEQCYSARDCR